MATRVNIDAHEGESVTITVSLQSGGSDLASGKSIKLLVQRPAASGGDFEVEATTDADGQAELALTASHTAYAGRWPFYVWNTTDDDLHLEGVLVVHPAEKPS